MKTLKITADIIANHGFSGPTVVKDLAHYIAIFSKELQKAATDEEYSDAYTRGLLLAHQASRVDKLIQWQESCGVTCEQKVDNGQKWFTQIFVMAAMYLLRSDNPKEVKLDEEEIADLIRSEGLWTAETFVCNCGGHRYELWEFNLDAAK